MPLTTLTFGDTFTLPITGDHPWKIRDLRADFAHITSRTDLTASARNTETLETAVYSPEDGWHVSPGETQHQAIKEQLDLLPVHLPQKSAEDYVHDYRRLLGRETAREVSEVVALIDVWTTGTTIDRVSLRAHVAASAALAAATTDDPALYAAVYDATLAHLLKEQK